MFLGRLCGWFLICLAVLVGSAEAVMALGTGRYDGIAAGDLWTLLSGAPPIEVEAAQNALLPHLAARLMDLPAWVVAGPAGLLLALACRYRRPRFRGRVRQLG